MLECISRVIFLLPLFSFGAIQNDTINRINLDEIIVKSAKIISNKKATPLSISSKNLSDDQVFAQQLSLQEYLNNIPGVFTTSANNFSQDLRLSIRGFGARSSFGIRGIKIIVDGIPQTSPDGQTQLDNLPIGIMESLEVIRGPAANLYGNSSGGVITINTISGGGQNKTNYKAIFGAYNYKSVMRLKTFNWDKTDLVVYYDTKESNGYRQFSGFKNKTINLKVSHRFSERSNLVYQLNSTNSPYAYDSGGLNIEEVQVDRTNARQRNIDYKFPYIDFLTHLVEYSKEQPIHSLYGKGDIRTPDGKMLRRISHFSPKGNYIFAQTIAKRVETDFDLNKLAPFSLR